MVAIPVPLSSFLLPPFSPPFHFCVLAVLLSLPLLVRKLLLIGLLDFQFRMVSLRLRLLGEVVLNR